MKSLIYLTAILVAVLASGCVRDVSAGQGANIPYSVESVGTQVGIDNQQFRVITTDTQFAELSSVATMSGNLPSVDYIKKELIAVFLGKNVGCGTDGLSVEKVEGIDSTVTVYVKRTVTSPPSDGPCTALPVNGLSYALVTIDKTSKPISLQFL